MLFIRRIVACKEAEISVQNIPINVTYAFITFCYMNSDLQYQNNKDGVHKGK